MGVLGGLLKTATSIALTPVGFLVDVGNLGESNATGECLGGAIDGIDEAVDSLF